MTTATGQRDPSRRLLINAIAERAKYAPNHTYMHYPSKDWETTGYRTITLGQYAAAVDRVAHWLDDQLGDASSSETVAYYGPNDPRYAIIVPAVIKTGRRVSFAHVSYAIWCNAHSLCDRFSFQTVAIHPKVCRLCF